MLKQLKTKKFWKIIARDGLILLLILFLYSLYQTRNMPDTTPDLQTSLISGEQVDIKNLSKKSPLLVYFWGSWCPMCSYTSSVVTQLSKDYSVVTIALSSGDNSQLKHYLLDNDYHFPVINDDNGVISHLWGVVATPTFFIINTQGQISYITTGISTLWGLKFRLWLAT
jgi:peroxiredoxin